MSWRFWRKSVFKNISINLTGPICSCEFEDLSWGPHPVENGYGLTLSCIRCGTKLVVSREKFRALFSFDKGYPKPRTAKPAADVVEKKDVEADRFMQDVLGLTLGEKKKT